jgi:hypothetical protein
MARTRTHPLPTRDRLRELYDYDRRGFFVRRRKASYRGPGRVGDLVQGTRNSSGILYVTVDGRARALSQLVWQWHNGDDPGRMRYVDGNPENCCISNLALEGM